MKDEDPYVFPCLAAFFGKDNMAGFFYKIITLNLDDPNALSKTHRNFNFTYGHAISGRYLLVWNRILSAKEMSGWKPRTNVFKIMTARDMNKSSGRNIINKDRTSGKTFRALEILYSDLHVLFYTVVLKPTIQSASTQFIVTLCISTNLSA